MKDTTKTIKLIIAFALFSIIGGCSDPPTAEQTAKAKIALACWEEIKLQLNYPEEANMHFNEYVVSDEVVMVAFDAKNAFGMKTEHIGGCMPDGSVVIEDRPGS